MRSLRARTCLTWRQRVERPAWCGCLDPKRLCLPSRSVHERVLEFSRHVRRSTNMTDLGLSHSARRGGAITYNACGGGR